MKTKQIFLIAIIIIVIGIIISSLYSSESYSTFKEATLQPNKEFQIIGKLDKTKAIQPETTGGFSFYLIDNNGTEMKCISDQTKPQHFEKLDQVILKGKVKDQLFIATQLLLKCPSKYTKKQFKQ